MAKKSEAKKSNTELAQERSHDEEVAVRQADSNSTKNFVKVYVIHAPNGIGAVETEQYTNATRQEAINRGLRPTGDVSHTNTEDHPDEDTYCLTFSVGVEPITRDDLPFNVEHAHADQEDQHGMEAGEDPTTEQTRS